MPRQINSAEQVEAFLEARRGMVAGATMRTDRWALMLLVDAHASLPLHASELAAFMASQERYLSGGGSMQRVWDTLRQFYAWLAETGYGTPHLPHVFYGRRRRGERRGRRLRVAGRLS